MKNIIFSLLLLSSMIEANTNTEDLSWVDEQVQAIKPARDGESNRNISRIKDPFIFLKKNSLKKDEEKKVSVKSSSSLNASSTKSVTSSTDSLTKAPVIYKKGTFKLNAIINSSALINGKWYKLGDIVNSYKIVSVDTKTVTLKNGSNKKVLSTATKNTKLKFKK